MAGNADARLQTNTCGSTEVVLRNDDLEVAILPEHGGEFSRLLDRRRNVDLLFTDVEGIRRFEEDRSVDHACGGLLTMFPNAGEAFDVGGHRYTYHGDLRAQPWTWDVLSGAAVELRGQSAATPFELTRIVTLGESGARVEIRDELRLPAAAGDEPLPFAYGIHPYFAHPLLGPGCQVRLGDKVVASIGDGDHLPDVFECLHDESGSGVVVVENAGVGSRVTLRFDPNFLPHVWLWLTPRWGECQNLGAVLPCTAHGLSGAAESATGAGASLMAPGASVTTEWSIELG